MGTHHDAESPSSPPCPENSSPLSAAGPTSARGYVASLAMAIRGRRMDCRLRRCRHRRRHSRLCRRGITGPLDLVLSMGWAGGLTSAMRDRPILPRLRRHRCTYRRTLPGGQILLSAIASSLPAPPSPASSKNTALPPPTTPIWSIWRQRPSPGSPRSRNPFLRHQGRQRRPERQTARFQSFYPPRRAGSTWHGWYFFQFSDPGTGPRSSGWARIARRLPGACAKPLLDFLDERAYIRERNGYPNFKP